MFLVAARRTSRRCLGIENGRVENRGSVANQPPVIEPIIANWTAR
jgi:hypothetical protein